MRQTNRLLILAFICSSTAALRGTDLVAKGKLLPFGEAGKFKMLYDARQRPQSVYLNDRLYIVYNGDAKPTKNSKGSARPMLITYDPQNRSFSKPVRLGQKSSSDHHYSPIIWADEEDSLHVLFGCHKTPGTHLVSEHPVQKEASEISWKKLPHRWSYQLLDLPYHWG